MENKQWKEVYMKKNAFTLIELLAILVILAVLAIILIPTIKNSIEDAKKSAYNNQVASIKSAAETYFVNSNFIVDSTTPKVMYLTDIVSSGYIESSKITNPVTEEAMMGCVLIKFYSNQYHYDYIDSNNECEKYQNIRE